jgi:citrate synthase
VSSPHARALDAAMVLQADHGLNASTFAARVAAGTLADLHSAITSAVSTLKGPLHGGASRQVMELILEISNKSRVRETVERMLKAKRTIPGFGHRVYKVKDPRAVELKKILTELVKAGADPTHFEIATELEEVVQRRKKLEPNLDLYLAPLYQMLGIPQELFAPLFGCSRIAGWVAHVIEQHLDNRLIRPLEEYIGPLSRQFVPIGERR